MIFVCPEPLDRAGEAEIHHATINPLAHLPIARRLPSVARRLAAKFLHFLLPATTTIAPGLADPPISACVFPIAS
jgi:hypothetical protein